MPKEPHKQFWSSETNLTVFRQGAEAYRKAKDYNGFNQVYSDAKGTRFGLELPHPDTAMRFMKGSEGEKGGTERPRGNPKLSNLFYALCELVEEFENSIADAAQPAKPNKKFDAIKALRSRLRDVLTPPPPPDDDDAPAPKREVPDERDLLVFFNILSTFMKIERGNLLDAYKTFFTKDDVERLPAMPDKRVYTYYDLYRPHAEPGRIVKSFLVIGLVGYSFGHACYFTNYFRPTRGPEADVRVARGMTIPTKRVLYLIGEIEGGIGLKILGVDDPGTPRRKFTGFLMTFQENLTPTATRFLMKKSRHTHSDSADIGTYTDEDLREELGDDLRSLRIPIG